MVDHAKSAFWTALSAIGAFWPVVGSLFIVQATLMAFYFNTNNHTDNLSTQVANLQTTVGQITSLSDRLHTVEDIQRSHGDAMRGFQQHQDADAITLGSINDQLATVSARLGMLINQKWPGTVVGK